MPQDCRSLHCADDEAVCFGRDDNALPAQDLRKTGARPTGLRRYDEGRLVLQELAFG